MTKVFSKIVVSVFLVFVLASCVSDDKGRDISLPDDNDSQPEQKSDSVDTEQKSADYNYLFDIDAVPEITISITKADWNQYLRNYDANKDNSLYVPAAFTFKKDGKVWQRDSVGLRPRGNTSRRRPEGSSGQMHQSSGTDWHHSHFGIKFTEYETGSSFFGCDRIVLKWFHGDPAYCREVFCYDLFRRFGVWSAPRASYCRLYIYVEGDAQPAYFGVYMLLEGVRKGWMKERVYEGHLTSKDGNLWKCGWSANNGANLSDFNYNGTRQMGISTDNMSYSYSLRTNKTQGLAAAQSELYNFMENMRPLTSGTVNLKQYLEQNMDVDLFLRALAVNVAVGMWDDYWVNQNNYYCYFDIDHRFYFIPYDYDNTLGTSKHINSLSNSGTQDPLHWGSRDGDRLLVKKVLSQKEYEQRYVQYLKQIVSDPDLMQPDAAIARVKHFESLIAPYVQNDTGEDMVIEDKPRQDDGDIDYRLLTGNDNGANGSNFFKTKKRAIDKL